MGALLQAWKPKLVRVVLTIAIVVGIWAAFHDPIGLVLAAVLVDVVWLWGRPANRPRVDHHY